MIPIARGTLPQKRTVTASWVGLVPAAQLGRAARYETGLTPQIPDFCPHASVFWTDGLAGCLVAAVGGFDSSRRRAPLASRPASLMVKHPLGRIQAAG